jgi:formate dehydrogenase subunit gamma
MTAFQPWNADVAAAIVESHSGRDGALLPILHDLQDAFGYVPAPAMALLAAALNLSRAEVHGVISFYHDFRHAPAGERVLKLCRAEACQARGGREVERVTLDAAGVAMGETRADGRLTVEAIYCLGLCASGPAALVDGEPVGRLTPASATALVRSLAQ